MAYAVLICDATATGEKRNGNRMEFEARTVTVRELIEQRVRGEVERFNAGREMGAMFQGLIQPTDTEATLNGYKMKKHRVINADAQCKKALKAFNENGYFILVDNVQVESLETHIEIGETTEVQFVKLTPLVGG